VQICGHFVEFTSGGAADDDQRAVLRDVIEAVLAAGQADSQPAVAARNGAAIGGPDDLGNADTVDEWLANAGRAGDWLADSDADLREGAGRRAAGGSPAAA
jgi:hypothetical protein